VFGCWPRFQLRFDQTICDPINSIADAENGRTTGVEKTVMKKKTGASEIAFLMTGNELMSGELTDTNSVFMAAQLADAGICVNRMVTVGDRFSDLSKMLEVLSRENDVVIVNGGLGSTVDDLTAEVAAFVSGKPLVERPEALKHISERLVKPVVSRESAYFNQLRRQALIPETADLLENSVGLALGFKLKINRAVCYFTPGVPREMQEMFLKAILPEVVETHKPGSRRRTCRLHIVGIGESQVQQLINQNVPEELQNKIEFGFRANLSYVELKLTIDDDAHAPALQKALNHVKAIMSEYIFSEGRTLPETLVDLLRGQKLRLTLAESCTGGLFASQITAGPGASDIFEAGLTTYSNAAKTRLLAVPDQLLQKCGAVSQQVAAAMAEGALKATGADLAVAVTGIAGPTGGSEEKPVGTVYISWGRPGNIQTRLMQVKRSRIIFQQLVCSAALDILRRYIQGLNTDGIYYFDEISRKRLWSEEQTVLMRNP